MEDKNKKLTKVNAKMEIIERRWILITIFFYLLIAIITSCYTHTYQLGMKENYYLRMITEGVYFPGIIFIISGYLINKIIDFKKKNNIGKMIVFIILIIITVAIGGRFIKNSSFYRYCKDLKYMTSNTYNEDVEQLKSVYIETQTSKITTKWLHVETINHNFLIDKKILGVEDENIFVEKYKNVNKV